MGEMKEKQLLCPYCNKEMEVGLIQNSGRISWLKGTKRHLFAAPEFYPDSVALGEWSALKGFAVVAYLCRDCQKVVIDYAEEVES